MVPQHSMPGEPRSLSPEVQRELENAMRAFATNSPDSATMLRNALAQAAAEGRVRELRAEELVVALRSIEQRVDELALRDDAARSDLRVRMIREMLEAYYRA